MFPYLSGVTYYLIGLAALSMAAGVQMVLLPWFVVDHFTLGSIGVGWLQTALLLPNFLFLIVGGAMADWKRALHYLPRIITLNAGLHLIVAVLVFEQAFNMAYLLIYATFLGLSNAFIQPARESLLKQWQQEGTQILVAKSSLCLYGGQALGALLAAFAQTIEAHYLLSLQACFLAMAVVSLGVMYRQSNLQEIKNTAEANRELATFSLTAGVKAILASPNLSRLIIIVGFNGFFHMGVFIVALPILVQDIYGESIHFFGSLQFTFLLGTLVASLVVIYRRGLNDPGKRMVFSVLYSGVMLLAIGAKPTVVGLFILIFAWGVVVGVSANMGRFMLQRLAPSNSTGQVIAIYQLALFGFAALGAIVGGLVITLMGVLPVFFLCGACSVFMFILSLLTRSLWDVT